MLGTPAQPGIPIPGSLTKKTSHRDTRRAYSYSHFDPTSSSPPDEFLRKLQERMRVYDDKSYIGFVRR